MNFLLPHAMIRNRDSKEHPRDSSSDEAETAALLAPSGVPSSPVSPAIQPLQFLFRSDEEVELHEMPHSSAATLQGDAALSPAASCLTPRAPSATKSILQPSTGKKSPRKRCVRRPFVEVSTSSEQECVLFLCFGCRVTWPPENELTDVLLIPPRERKPTSSVGLFLALIFFTWLLASFISNLFFR